MLPGDQMETNRLTCSDQQEAVAENTRDMAKKQIVFVDDDPTEVSTFMKLYDGTHFEVVPVTASDPHGGFISVVNKLGKNHPDLFVLDLYFPISNNVPTGFDGLSQQEFKNVTSAIVETRDALDSLDGSVKEAPHDGKRLLREAHTVVHRSRLLLDRWCTELGQSPQGGLNLLQELHEKYPDVPAVFYSRKATLRDAKEALAAGALDVVSKPDSSLESSQATKIAGAFQEYAEYKPPSFLAKWLKRVGVKIGFTPSGPTVEVSAEISR